MATPLQNKNATTKRRKYVYKSAETADRCRIASMRNWDALQLTNVIGQLKQLIYRAESPNNYTRGRGVGPSETLAKLRCAVELAENSLVAIKAHNKDPRNNPLP